MATPKVIVTQWWRGCTELREALWQGLLVEPAPGEIVQVAGVALGKMRGRPGIDAERQVVQFSARSVSSFWSGWRLYRA